MNHSRWGCRPHRVAAWALAGLLVLLAGCELDGRLDASGAGTLTIRYRLMHATQLETQKKRLQSDRVTVLSAEVTPDKWATFRIAFPDVGALSGTEFFQKTQFSLTEDGPRRHFTAVYANPDHDPLPEDLVAYYGGQMTMTLRVPGRLVTSNAPRATDDAATWTFGIQDFADRPRVEFTATYELAAGAAGSESPAVTASPSAGAPAP